MNSSSDERRSGFISGLIVGALATLAVGALAYQLYRDGIADQSLGEQAREAIEENYFEEVSDEELDESSIRGMIAALRKEHRDRFSHYFTPEQLRTFNTATEGNFSGVGLTVSEVKRGLRVAEVLTDSPAEEAGMKRGDVIVAVNGKSIAGVPSQVSTTRIKGEPGTEVTIRVDPVDGGNARDLDLERATVRLPVAEGEIVKTPGGTEAAHVRFAGFSRGAHGELREEIERLDRQGAGALILDLRGNGGGLLDEAVLTSSLFVNEGDDVVTTRSRTRGEQIYDAQGEPIPDRPTIVLINRDTASAAEILAAAIQSYGLGTILGEDSFGKGTFQEVIDLPAGGAVDLTVGEYLTADGTSLAGEGVKPDERAVDDPKTPGDEALRKALRLLDSPGPGAGTP
ncbi:MAG: S41 family peptidase [Actinomycetota bacterium]|nr:S41 family peptidase [Actinomycetota bacterium]